MAKYLKSDCVAEQKLQEVEELMRNNGIELTSYGGNGLTIRFAGSQREYWIQSIEDGQKSHSFPRMTDNERLALME